MRLQCKMAGADSFFLVEKCQYELLAAEKDMVYVFKDARSKKKEQATKVKVYWNAFQRDGNKRQEFSIASGYFATSFVLPLEPAGGEELPLYDRVMGGLKGHETLTDHVRVIYVSPDGRRLIVVSRMYEGYDGIKACQEVLCRALGWKCTKGCSNLNREYPFPMRDSVLFEDGRMWTEMDGGDGRFLQSDSWMVEFDKDANMEYIGEKTNWVRFLTVADGLANGLSQALPGRDVARSDGAMGIPALIASPPVGDDGMVADSAEMERRRRLLSDEGVPEVWPFPLDLIGNICPYNFIRPMLIMGSCEIATMLNGFRGMKELRFARPNRKKRGQLVEKAVRRLVGNGLFVIVEGAASTGKSQFSVLHKLLWREHINEDAETYREENDYLDEANRRAQNKQLKKKPELKVNCLSPNTSFSELMDRIAVNGGRMMVCHSPEIHDLFSSLANGGSAKEVGTKFSSFLRMIYDQDEFSVDYKTYNSKRGFHKGCINYFVCSTPGARSDTFRSPEDGLVSRLWFVSLNEDRGGGWRARVGRHDG